jgi:excisionase family DNA binding protein
MIQNIRIMTETIFTTLTRNDLKALLQESIQELLADQNRQVVITNSELMTTRQAAEYLNMALPTLYGYVNRDQIPFLKRGRLHFRKADLDNWLSEK